MVSTVGSIAINLATNVYEFERGFKSAATTVERESARMSGALGGFANAARTAGSLITGFVGGLAAGVVPELLNMFAQAAGAAIRYFREWIGSARISAEELAKQRDLISQVAGKWNNATSELDKYSAAFKAQAELEKLMAANLAAQDQAYAKVGTRVRNLAVDLETVIATMQELGVETAIISAVQKAFAGLEQKVRDNTAAGADALLAHNALMAAYKATGIPVLKAFADQVDRLAPALDRANASARKLDNTVLDRIGELRDAGVLVGPPGGAIRNLGKSRLPRVFYGGQEAGEVAKSRAADESRWGVHRTLLQDLNRYAGATNKAAGDTAATVEQMASAERVYHAKWVQWSMKNDAYQARIAKAAEDQARLATSMSTFKSTLGIAGSQGSWVGKQLTFGPMSSTIGMAGSGSWPGNALNPLGPYIATPNQPALDATTSTPGAANINVTTIVRPVLEGTRLSTQSVSELKQAAAAGTNAALRAFHGR